MSQKKKSPKKVDVDYGIIKSKRLTKEDEYVAKQEEKLIQEHTRRLEEKKKEETRRLEEEKARLKELHHMRCPKCGMGLEEITFMGVLIDVCGECQGVWLDHGELETLMLKEAGFFSKLKQKMGLTKTLFTEKQKKD